MSITATPGLSAPAAPPVAPDYDDDLYEVVDGKRVGNKHMSVYAGLVATRLGNLLAGYSESQRLGTVLVENLFILDPVRDIRRRPDVAFVSARQWPLDRELPETGDWAIVPELAVEVVSPHDVMTAVMAKRDEYFRYGVRQDWIVLPSQQEIQIWDGPGQVRALTAATTLEGDPVIPGFRQTVAALLSRRPGGVSAPTE